MKRTMTMPLSVNEIGLGDFEETKKEKKKKMNSDEPR